MDVTSQTKNFVSLNIIIISYALAIQLYFLIPDRRVQFLVFSKNSLNYLHQQRVQSAIVSVVSELTLELMW